MTQTLECDKEPRLWEVPKPRMPKTRETPKNPKRNRLPIWGVLVGLALYLLFAHGCHGDEDTELFGIAKEKAAEMVSAAR